MKKIKSFLVLCRWEYLPSAINETGIPALMALFYVRCEKGYWLRVIASLLIWWIAHFIGAQVNNLSDYKADKMFKSYISSSVDDFGVKKVKKMIAVEMAIGTIAVVLLACFLKLPLLIVLWIVGVFFAFAYSCKPFHFKSRVIMNPVCLGVVLYLVPMTFSYLLIVGKLHAFPIIVIFLFTLQIVPMFFMDEVSDYEEDKIAKINNPCVHFGRRPTILISIIIYLIACLATYLTFVFSFSPTLFVQKILISTSTAFFCFVVVDFCYIYAISDTNLLKDEKKLFRLKKSIITPVWLMGSGIATILLVSTGFIK